jgi:hypothetical protein
MYLCWTLMLRTSKRFVTFRWKSFAVRVAKAIIFCSGHDFTSTCVLCCVDSCYNTFHRAISECREALTPEMSPVILTRPLIQNAARTYILARSSNRRLFGFPNCLLLGQPWKRNSYIPLLKSIQHYSRILGRTVRKNYVSFVFHVLY